LPKWACPPFRPPFPFSKKQVPPPRSMGPVSLSFLRKGGGLLWIHPLGGHCPPIFSSFFYIEMARTFLFSLSFLADRVLSNGQGTRARSPGNSNRGCFVASASISFEPSRRVLRTLFRRSCSLRSKIYHLRLVSSFPFLLGFFSRDRRFATFLENTFNVTN